MRRAPLVFLLAVTCFLSALQAAVPTPASILGKDPGDDFYLASYDDAKRYFSTLAASSDRIKLFTVGKSTRGVDIIVAAISSPANLAQLDHYKNIERQLAQARGLSDAQARALAREGKAIVHIDGGLHSTEVAGGQHSIQLAYKLTAAHGDREIDGILDNVILLLWPSLNPDGQNMVASWYRRNLGTPYEVSPLPWLYQEYVGHDNNRDGYMLNMIESQVVTKTELDWNPVIFYCQHQSAPFPARIWIPPFSEPISANIHPLMLRWLNVIGTNMAAYLDSEGMPGSIHRSRFDNWYPGFVDYTHIFRNEVSFFTETALYNYATPHFYTVDEFPKNEQDLKGDVMYSSPWHGGWWHLRDAVNYMVGGSMSVLDTAYRYRETLLYNRYQAARDNIARFRNNPPFAYVIPSVQRDVPEAALLMQKMIDNGLEVHQAQSGFLANGREYPAGSWVILMDQPYSPLAKELFEPQVYPVSTDPGKPVDFPYDVTGWTLPMQMGVEVAPVLVPLTDEQRARLTQVDKATAPSGEMKSGGASFSIDGRTTAAYKLINAAFAKGASVSFHENRVLLGGINRQNASALSREFSVSMDANNTHDQNGRPIQKAQIGLYRPWEPSIDEGWTRWILEQYGFAPVSVYNGDIRAGHLRGRFNSIIIPDLQQDAIMEGFKTGIVPGEYAGGIGEDGLDSLRQFVREGGTLVAFNHSALALITLLKLPVTNVLEKLKNEEFFCSGALLRVQITQPVRQANFGMPDEAFVMFERGPAFEPAPDFRGAILASYPRDRNPLASGFLQHPERIQGKAAALELAYGKGRIFLYGFKPQWRAQSHATYRMFFNVLYEYGTEAPSLTVPPQAAAKTDESKKKD